MQAELVKLNKKGNRYTPFYATIAYRKTLCLKTMMVQIQKKIKIY
ncbi:hypothetical protein ES705_17159 [subsurface metagenome]